MQLIAGGCSCYSILYMQLIAGRCSCYSILYMQLIAGGCSCNRILYMQLIAGGCSCNSIEALYKDGGKGGSQQQRCDLIRKLINLYFLLLIKNACDIQYFLV